MVARIGMNHLSIRRCFFVSLLWKMGVEIRLDEATTKRWNLERGRDKIIGGGGAFIGIAFDPFLTNPVGKDPLYVEAFGLKKAMFFFLLFSFFFFPRAFYVRAAPKQYVWKLCASF